MEVAQSSLDAVSYISYGKSHLQMDDDWGYPYDETESTVLGKLGQSLMRAPLFPMLFEVACTSMYHKVAKSFSQSTFTTMTSMVK